MRQDEGTASLLPRPNLGPEPWPEPPGFSAWWWLSGVILLAAIAGSIRRRRDVPAPLTLEDVDGSAARSCTERLIALAQTVRQAMSTRVGPTWAARTTEEMAASLGDVEPAVRERILRLLDDADQAKFAGGSVDDAHLRAAEVWAAEALAGLRAEGARSIQNGR